MNLLDIKTAVANYFGKTLADLTVLSQDIFLVAANQVRRFAELNNDFEYSRRLVRVSVDRVTGGSLLSATQDGASAGSVLSSGVTNPVTAGVYVKQLGFINDKPWYVKFGTTAATTFVIFYSGAPNPVGWRLAAWANVPDFAVNGNSFFRASGDTPVGDLAPFGTYTGTATISAYNDWRAVKSVIEMGIFDEDDNLRPVTWTTVGESLERQRKESRFSVPRYPTDAQVRNAAGDASRVDLRGNELFLYPKPITAGTAVEIGVECYTFFRDWTSDDLVSNYAGDDWTNNGDQFLQWGTILHLNHKFKEFVFRQEGNLPPPTDLRNEGLASFMAWDAHKFEQNRRHSR